MVEVTNESINENINRIRTFPVVGLDIETTSLDPYEGQLRLIQLSTEEDTYIIDLFKVTNTQYLKEFFEFPKPIKVIHNAKFDTKWIKYCLGVEVMGVFDTYLASLIISAGDPDRHSLEDVAQRYLDVELDKTEQKSDWSGELTESQLRYAAEDAEVLPPLRLAMIDVLKSKELVKCAALEFQCIPAIVDLELNGIFLNREDWLHQVRLAEQERDRIADELQEMLAPAAAQQTLFWRQNINLNSTVQLRKALLGIGVPVPESTINWKIKPLERDHPSIKKLLEYRKFEKQLTAFGENIVEFIHPKTGRIHADYRQIGAATGRFSCNNPNIQQIPHQDEFRRCFQSTKGKLFVVSDYSQIELRILAEYSRDPAFITDLSTNDLHTVTASSIFNVPVEQVKKDQRSIAKNLNFGVVYGIGPKRFSMVTGVSIPEAERMIKSYFNRYKVVNEWLTKASYEAIVRGHARTKSGRLMNFHFDPNNKDAVSAVERNGKNTPIQGTGADILKRALYLLHGKLKGTGGKLVNIVHDEIVVESDSDEAEGIAQLVEESMRQAGEEYISAVPIEISTAITDAWVK